MDNKNKKSGSNSNVTIKDIARLSGKSYATVSRALNEKYGVNEKTREIIRQAAKELGYQPNIVARNLVKNRTNTIGLIIPDVTNPFFADIVYSVEEYATKYKYSLVITNTNWRQEVEKERLDLLVQSRVDGIIIKTASDENISLYKRNYNLPIVVLTSQPDCEKSEQEGNFTYIDYDDETGGFIATEHLIEMGYKKIAYIGGKTHAYSNIGRLKGFKKALKKYDINYYPEYILEGSFYFESGRENADKLFKLKNPPDAVVCANDIVALGVTQSAIEAGLDIPNDLGVVGYDDITFSSLHQIQLTTVAQPRFHMGTLAAQTLLEKIESNSDEIPNQIILEPYLIKRNSTSKIKKNFINSGGINYENLF